MVKKLLSLCWSENQQNGGVDFQRMDFPFAPPLHFKKKKKRQINENVAQFFHAERSQGPSVSLYPTEERVVQVINMSAW